MTVGELKALLESLPADAEVAYADDYMGGVRTFGGRDVRLRDMVIEDDGSYVEYEEYWNSMPGDQNVVKMVIIDRYAW